MRFAGIRVLFFAGAIVLASIIGAAQAPKDPRVGLKPGLRDAGQAARGMELVANVPKPKGFFDPQRPAGEPTPPEEEENEDEEETEEAKAAPGSSGTKPDDARPDGGKTGKKADGKKSDGKKPRRRSSLNYANSDLAFRDDQLFVGNFSGFNIYDISNPRKPRLISPVVCPGGQGDVSIHGNLLFMSVEQTRGRLDCGTKGVDAPISTERFRGVRIFDISNVKKPRQVAAVQTCRGSHTHTLLVDPKDTANVYVYGSGTSSVRSAEELAGCSGADPKENPDTSLFSIDVIKVPLAAPDTAAIVNRPRIFADLKTGAVSGLWPGGDHGPGTQKTATTNQCHDITVYPEVGLAAGACSGNGILLDISDPVNPVRLDHVSDRNFAYWHSATFNNDGSKVVFTDEWGGGTRPRCLPTSPETWGANAIFDIVDRKLQFRSYYKLPAPQTEQENCVAHNGSIVPVPGRDIMVQGWYQGGVSVFDFTDSAKPVEIAFFDRGPVDAKALITAGQWSTYWYNGYIYGSEIARGLDVLRLTPGEHLSQNEIDAAGVVRLAAFNAQQQPHVVWPADPVVARAYLDQLTRTQAVSAERAAAVEAALGGSDRAANAQLADGLEQDAGSAPVQDALRLRALASVLRGEPPAGPQTATHKGEPGFTNLFNGMDLTGWKVVGPAESFSVEDGAIVAKGAASHAYYSGPFNDHSFRDFELKVDIMTRPGSNGGVYVLTKIPDEGSAQRFPTTGFEIQVNNSHTDRIRSGSLYHVLDVLDDSPAKDNEWFTEHIIVKGNTITVNVDGKQVATWTQPEKWDGGRGGSGRRIAGPGTIAFQAHDPKSIVYYKNVRIKILN